MRWPHELKPLLQEQDPRLKRFPGGHNIVVVLLDLEPVDSKEAAKLKRDEPSTAASAAKATTSQRGSQRHPLGEYRRTLMALH